MPTTSDTLLVRLCQPESREQAWERFVAIYTGLLFNWARSCGLQRADAGDVVQEVLIIVYRELPNYERLPGVRFRSWLWAITRNRIREFQRKRRPASLDNMEPAVYDQPSAETAAELGISVGAIYNARFRVQRRIRDELAGFLD